MASQVAAARLRKGRAFDFSTHTTLDSEADGARVAGTSTGAKAIEAAESDSILSGGDERIWPQISWLK